MSMDPDQLTLPEPAPAPPVPSPQAPPETPTRRADVRAEAEQLLRDAGVDVEAPEVRLVLDSAPEEIISPEGQGLVAYFAQLYPSSPATAYSQALDVSGFTGPLIGLGTTTPSEVRGVAATQLLGPGENYRIHPETGWVMFRSGVLFDPSTGELIFEPNSTAPGSALWLKHVQEAWSAEKVAEWRSRLAEFGYLSPEEAKAEGVDRMFLDALQAYHVTRYQNFGTAIPLDLSASAGVGRASLTAEDLQAQIRGSVREEFRRIAGREPSDGEVAEWARFVTRTSLQMQRRFMRRGVSEGQALSVATTEAEERAIERMETSPGAEFMRESAEENTRLRDALASAVVVTRSLTG